MKIYCFYISSYLLTGALIAACAKKTSPDTAKPLQVPGNLIVAVTHHTATLSWEAVTGAIGYKAEVSSQPAFGTVIAVSDTLHTLTFEAKELSPSTTYYARVRALSDKNPSLSSTVSPVTFQTTTAPEIEQALAFPGAEGFGKSTTGGRGGQVIKVANLNDAGAGSLRAAIEAAGPRIVVFEVSGNIKLASPLRIRNNDITIAGQTAPGDGICVQDYEMNVDADNVIIRYLRFRMGDLQQREQDALWGRYHKNIIIDHCSMSWSIDECASFYGNQSFTMQWCILAESLNKSFHEKDDHGYGGIWGGKDATFHHNLLAHHNSRNPRFNGGLRAGIDPGPYPGENLDYRNNIVYNWGDNSTYGGENGSYNMVANYYKPGPGTPSGKRTRLLDLSIAADVVTSPPGYGTFYIIGNIMHGNTGITQDNWTGVNVRPGVNLSVAKAITPVTFEAIPQHTAEAALEAVLGYAGASLKRDAVDTRVTNEVRNGSVTYYGSKTGKAGIIDSQTDVGGWPVLQSLSPQQDSDGDGMPDAWETANGLNPAQSNANGHNLSSVYDNIEIYINSLVKQITEAQKT